MSQINVCNCPQVGGLLGALYVGFENKYLGLV